MSQHDETKAACIEVQAELAEELTGMASRKVLEHLVDCEACRGIRRGLQEAAGTVRAAAADYVHPADFMARLAVRWDAAGYSADERTSDTSPDVAVPSAMGPGVEPSSDDSFFDRVSRRAEGVGAKVVPLFRGRGRWWALGVVAAALLALWVRPKESAVPELAGGERFPALTDDRAPWSGTVSAVAALRDGGSLSVCDQAGRDCRLLNDEARFPGGVMLKTDAKARARLSLADGTEVVLGRSTSFVVGSNDERRAKLLVGQAVLDVRQDASLPASIQLPHGRVEVVGTKLSLRAQDDSSWVSVIRGQVRVVDDAERAVSLAAGQGTRVGAGRAPVARHLASLAGSFAWSERGFEPEPRDADLPDASPRGLGELRANKPGEDDEREGAVTLTRQKVKVRISGAMARTEVEQEFSNQTDEVLEGIYRFPLPPGAQIERLALEVDGRWEEGAFVDRERAAAIWRGAIVNSSRKKPAKVDDIVWVPGPWKDPALLEWQRGGSFELRIFPIPKRGTRRIILSYTEWLESESETRRYTYPLPHDGSGSVSVDDFSLDVQVQGHVGSVMASGVALTPATGELSADFDGVEKERLTFTQQHFTPAGDVVLQFGVPGGELTSWAYRDANDGDGYVALALRPELPPQSTDEEQSYVIVVDRSRSMYGEHYHRATRLATRIIRELDPRFRVGVLACDSTCDADSTRLEAAGEAAAQRARSFLEGQTPEGASNLVQALSSASQWLRRSGRGTLRVVYIGDGSPTAGAIQPGLIQRELSRSLAPGVNVSAVTVGSASDDAALRAATNQSGGLLMRFSPGRTLSDVAYDVLAATSGHALERAQLTLPPGLRAAAPAEMGTIAAGGEAVVVAKFTTGAEVSGPVTLRGTLAGRPFERTYQLDVRAESHRGNAFLPRLYASKRIAELESDPAAEAKQQAIELSERFNVASRHTSLLVLESPAMFKAFGLRNERHAPLWTGEEASFETSAFSEEAKSVTSGLGTSADFASGAGGVGRSAPRPASRTASKPKRRPPVRADSRCPPGDPSCGPQPFPMDDEQAEPSPPARVEERPLARCDCAPADLMCAMHCGPLPPDRRSRRLVPMRRVWQSSGKITAHVDDYRLDSSLSPKEAALRQQPESRAALAELYAAYMAAGQLERAADLAERWSDKDPLDPDALTARADVAAQRGDRDLAVRILGSVVDVRPDEHQAQWRLARLFRWAGQAERSCAHYVAVAQLRSNDAEALADALRCSEELGDRALGEDLRSGATPDVRRQAETQLRQPASDDLRGEFQAVARWDGNEDLDVVFIHPAGYRVSWLGAPTRAVISARDVSSRGRDALALRGVRPGRYGVEVVRSVPGGRPVSGSLEVQFRGEKRTFSFVLDGQRVRVADVSVTSQQVLVPL